jgi:hypothetical protein
MFRETIKDVRELLNIARPAEQMDETDPVQPLTRPCPCCGGRMFIIETFEPGCQPRRPHLSSRSGSISHDREYNLPHHRARVALVIDRQRCRAAQQVSGTA